ncbi:unnamed protein product [Owenia fusiformis]|nr:unnamed protein product [Owenia fusiformis]
MEFKKSNVEEHLFNLNFAVKHYERNSKKCENEEETEKNELKEAIQDGNVQRARIRAENAIRQKNQALQYGWFSARIDAVAQRVQTAITSKQLTGSMARFVQSMDTELKSSNLEKVAEIMDRFEEQFGDLGVQSQVMECTISNTTTQTVPQAEVDSLIQEVADQHG